MLKMLTTPLLLAVATISLAAQSAQKQAAPQNGPTDDPHGKAKPAVQESKTKEAQETKEERKKKPSVLEELAPQFGAAEGDDLRAEMARLFIEVEQNLLAIDDELAMAGAGEIELGAVADSGIDKLLRSQKDKSNQVVADIDRILEITEQLGGT